ncbi:MAG: hypothetical protein HYV16_10790 [Gammaproteobacteria bacterium]|nr:hypothetical protein [Gammaproteobacteria bacterium]
MSSTESAQRLSVEALPGGWALSHYHAPQLATQLQPGISLRAGERLLAPMACQAGTGRISLGHRRDEALPEILELAVSGGAVPLPSGPLLLLAQDAGLFPLVWWLSVLRQAKCSRPLVLLGTNNAFPFQPAPSRILLPDLPPWLIATMPLLDDWQTPGRLAHADGLPGCHEGEVLELAALWLAALYDGQQPGILLFGDAAWQEAARTRLPNALGAYETR